MIALIWSTYLGAGDKEYLSSLFLDQYDQVYVSGFTTSPDSSLKAPIQNYAGPYNTSNPTAQFFVATLSGSLSSIEYYSTYFGTAASCYDPLLAPYLAVDPALNVYVAATDTNNVQPTPGSYSVEASSLAASWKVLISKLTIMDDVAAALSATPAPESDLTDTIAVTRKGPDFGVNVRASDTLPAGTTFETVAKTAFHNNLGQPLEDKVVREKLRCAI